MRKYGENLFIAHSIDCIRVVRFQTTRRRNEAINIPEKACFQGFICTAGYSTRKSCTLKLFWHDNNIWKSSYEDRCLWRIVCLYTEFISKTRGIERNINWHSDMMKTVEKTGYSRPKTQIFSVLFPYGKAAIVCGLWKIHTETALSSIISENT